MSLLRGFALSALSFVSSLAFADGNPGVRLPAFERVTLANGAVVALMEKHDTPLISLAADVRGGSIGDPAGKEGTAALFAELIQKGAGTRNAAQFAEAIESVGGGIGAEASTESISVSASFMARDADLMIALVADALQRPRLAPDEFAKVRTLAIQDIAAAKDSDPRALIGEYGDAWLFHGHPYGRATDGSESTLAGITLDDVKRYYAEQVGGDRIILAVVGDFPAAEMRRKLEAAFGTWRKAGRDAAAGAGAATPAGPQGAARRQAGRDADVLLARQRGRQPHGPRAHPAVGGEQRVRRQLHLDVEHRTAHQERTHLRRERRLQSRDAAGFLQHPVVHADGEDRGGARSCARDARSPAPGRARCHEDRVVAGLPARAVPADARDERPARRIA